MLKHSFKRRKRKIKNRNKEMEQMLEHDPPDIEFPLDEILTIWQDEEAIKLPSGEFFVEKLILEKPIKLVGEGKDSTILKCKTLEIHSENVVFENLNCKADLFLPKKKPDFVNSSIEFIESVSEDLRFAVGIKATKEIEISKPITLKNAEIYYENVIFLFSEDGNITFENCKCNFTNCLFKRIGKSKNSSLILNSSDANIQKCDFVENATLEILGQSSIQLTNCIFSDNVTGLIQASSSEVKIENCEFFKNLIGVEVKDNAKLRVSNSKFFKHENASGDATGIIGLNNSQLEVENCEFSENQKGIEAENDVQLTVSSSKFYKHENLKGIGAGIIAFENSKIEVRDCEFNENQRGIEARHETKLKVLDSKFIENIAPDSEEGGAGIITTDNVQLEVENCEFTNNKRGVNVQGESRLRISKSRFVENGGSLNFYILQILGVGIGGYQNSQLEIEDCEFIRNHLGIMAHGNSKIKILNSKFTKNAAPPILEIKGTGIIANLSSHIEIKNCEFAENITGIIGLSNSQIQVENCEFAENQEGIRVLNKAKLKALNSKFTKHCDPDHLGTGITGLNSSQLEIKSCEFAENQIGIGAKDKTNLKVFDSKFIKNEAPTGFGTGIIVAHNSQINIENCEFSENQRGIEAQIEAKLRVLKSKFTKHIGPDSFKVGITCADNTQLEVEGCEFAENQVDVAASYDVKSRILDCKLNVLFSNSPNIRVVKSNINTVMYMDDLKKPVLEETYVGNWQKVVF